MVRKDYINIITSLVIFGSIGVFRNFIPFPSSVISFARGFLGTLFLLLMVLIQKRPIDKKGMKENFKILAFSGILIGINWIFLFEAYRFTTVAVATMALYMQPTFVILASPFVLGEKLSSKKLFCAFIAILGMILVSGIFKTGLEGTKGIVFGLIAALLYAIVIILNKFIKSNIEPYEKTIIQLLFATLIVMPYIFLTEDVTALKFTPTIIIMLLIVGSVHTGIAYSLYFSSIESLSAQTIALLSYIDPVVAVFLSAIILKENLTLPIIIGSAMILGSAYFGDRVK
ncbi:MAG: EamA family transporter [Tissierellia bacterium]|nr:EamA family transporter [Tissierellia bacterium]